MIAAAAYAANLGIDPLMARQFPRDGGARPTEPAKSPEPTPPKKPADPPPPVDYNGAVG